jgi:hypothetical protein
MRRHGTAFALAVLVAAATGGCAGEEPAPAPAPIHPSARVRPALVGWPPRLGQTYPDVEFHDQQSRPVRLSSLRGKVVLIEPIGMNCPACNAFAGAGRNGRQGFQGTRPQADLRSIEDLLAAYAGGVAADHPDLVLVHLLLYDMRMRAPTAEDARRWAAHFGIDRPNQLVLHGDERFIGRASYDLIPGFQLLDRDLVLQADSTGHHPRHDLYTFLLPLLGEMLGRP